MLNKLQSEMESISKLFSHEFFYNIPDYQRPFMWDQQNFDDLVDDLLTASRNEPYFLGTLVLYEDEESIFQIVDGQQRITSLCLLIACMRDALAAAGDPQSAEEMHQCIVQPAKKTQGIPAKNRLQVKEQTAFNAIIGGHGGASKPLPNEINTSPASKRYEIARKTFWERLNKLSAQELESFTKFVVTKCNLIYLVTDTFENAFRLFTIVNDRGKQLRRVDVLKAYNLNPDLLPSEGERSHYAHQWDEMEIFLGEKHFEELFQRLRLIYLKDKPKHDLLSEFEKRIFDRKKMPKRGPEFIDELEGYVNLYNSLFLDRDYLDNADLGIKHVQFHTMMAAMMRYFSASEWQACILSYARKFKTDRMYDFLIRVERIYLDEWVRGIRKDERYSTYINLLKDIENAASVRELFAELGEFDDRAIREACSEDIYEKGYTKYVMVRAEIAASELNDARDFEARSIEHVLPQNPSNPSKWREWFSDEEHAALVNKSGNLVLLSANKNSGAGRKEFAEKREKYLKPKISDFPRSLEVLGHDTWTPEIVSTRTARFVDLVLSVP